MAEHSRAKTRRIFLGGVSAYGSIRGMKKYGTVVLAACLCTMMVGQARAEEDAAKSDSKSGGGAHTGWIIKDGGPHTRPMEIDISAGIVDGWAFGTGFGLAAWFAYPIVPDGFIPKINNSFDIEGGLTFGVHPFYWVSTLGAYGAALTISPMAGVRWNFHLTDAWTVFATIKLGIAIGLNDGGLGFSGGGGIGAIWHINDSMQLRLETGSITPASVGLTFPL